MADSFEAIGTMLLQPATKSPLAYMRCDAFDVLEGEAHLSLRERVLLPGAIRLLTGLLKNNRDLQELDFAATGLRKEWALGVIETLAPSVTALHFPYNPVMDEGAQAALLAAVEKRFLKTVLHF